MRGACQALQCRAAVAFIHAHAVVVLVVELLLLFVFLVLLLFVLLFVLLVLLLFVLLFVLLLPFTSPSISCSSLDPPLCTLQDRLRPRTPHCR